MTKGCEVRCRKKKQYRVCRQCGMLWQGGLTDSCWRLRLLLHRWISTTRRGLVSAWELLVHPRQPALHTTLRKATLLRRRSWFRNCLSLHPVCAPQYHPLRAPPGPQRPLTPPDRNENGKQSGSPDLRSGDIWTQLDVCVVPSIIHTGTGRLVVPLGRNRVHHFGTIADNDVEKQGNPQDKPSTGY